MVTEAATSLLSAGVKVAVCNAPSPDNPDKVPPVTVMSDAEKLSPGASLNVNVIVAVSPDCKAVSFVLMVTFGAFVSILNSTVPAVPALLIASR